MESPNQLLNTPTDNELDVSGMCLTFAIIMTIVVLFLIFNKGF